MTLYEVKKYKEERKRKVTMKMSVHVFDTLSYHH